MAANRTGDAEKLVDEELTRIRQTTKPGTNSPLTELIQSGRMHLSIKNDARAEVLLRECNQLIEGKTGDAKSPIISGLLGESLLRQKKYADAEPFLTRSYQEFKNETRTKGRARKKNLAEAIDRLIQLAEEMNKPDEVKKWKAERDRL